MLGYCVTTYNIHQISVYAYWQYTRILEYAFQHFVHYEIVYISAIIGYNREIRFYIMRFRVNQNRGGYIMPIQYKIDVLSELKKAGYSTYILRKNKILSESTIQKFRENEMVSYEALGRLCRMLECQPGDILVYIPEDSEQ